MSSENIPLAPQPQAATEAWLHSVVIAHNFCPFAKQSLALKRLRFYVSDSIDIETCLLQLINECNQLDTDETLETTLLIYSAAFADFDDYLDFLSIAEALLIEQGYEGVYQLASFHPHYCFDGTEQDDPANYTNRSPYPMLHLLRESSVEKALAHFPNPENIPRNNMALTRRLGLAHMQALLADCYPTSS